MGACLGNRRSVAVRTAVHSKILRCRTPVLGQSRGTSLAALRQIGRPRANRVQVLLWRHCTEYLLLSRRPTANLEDTALPERAARRGRAEPVPISGPHGSHAGPIHRWKKRSRSRGGWSARTGLGAAQERDDGTTTADSVCGLRQSAHGHQHRQQQQWRGAEQFAEGL